MPVDRAGGRGADVLHGGQSGGAGDGVVAGRAHGACGECGCAGAHGAERPRGHQVRDPVPGAGARCVRNPRCACAVAAARARGLWVVWDPDMDRGSSYLSIVQHSPPGPPRRQRGAVVGDQRRGIWMLPGLLAASGTAPLRFLCLLFPSHRWKLASSMPSLELWEFLRELLHPEKE